MDFRDSKTRLILIVVALGIALVVVVSSCGGGDDGDGGGSGQGTSSTAGQDAGDDDGKGDGDGGEGDADGAEPEDAESEQRILAEVTGGDNLTLTVTRAEREEGGFVTVEGTLHNGASSGWRDSAWAGPESELVVNGFSMSGATLTAKAEGKKYLILRDTSGRCLCTRFDLEIAAGETVNWFAQFPAPEAGTKEVDFQIGQLPPATFEID